MTKEVAKHVLESLDYYLQNRFEDYGERNHGAMMIAIKALEQEAVLDKIREEIKLLSNANPSYWHCGDMVEREEVFEIIDEYMGKHTSGGDTE